MTQLGVIFRPDLPPERLRAVALAAERSGLDELWLWEDCFCQGGISAASAVLAWTQRLHVGIGVLPVPLRNVAVTAMEIATLSRLFPGRIEVGVGHGVLDWMGQVGARVQSPMTLLSEYVTALRALLDGQRVTKQGRYVQLRDVKLQHPPAPGLSLHIAAIRDKTLTLAGELGEGTVLTSATSPDEVRRARAVVDAAREASGRAGRNRVTVYLLVGRGADAADGVAEQLRSIPDFAATDFAAAASGDASAVACSVRRWADAGADAVALVPLRDDDTVDFTTFVGDQVRPLLGSACD